MPEPVEALDNAQAGYYKKPSLGYDSEWNN